MKLTNATVQSLRPKAKAYSISDGGGLFVEVMSSGLRVWRIRYRLNRKQEKATLGEYPSFSLAEARKWREDCRGLVARGISPAAERKKQKGEPTGAQEVADHPWLGQEVRVTSDQALEQHIGLVATVQKPISMADETGADQRQSTRVFLLHLVCRMQTALVLTDRLIPGCEFP